MQKLSSDTPRKRQFVNWNGTRYIKVSRQLQRKPSRKKLREFEFEEGEDFKYGGSMINRTNQKETKIKQKMQAGHEMFYRFRIFRINRNISIQVLKSNLKIEDI